MGYQKAPPAPVAPLLQATGAGQAYSIPDLALPEAQEELFQRLSWVYGAVMAVATTVASADFSVKKIVGDKRKDIANHPLELRLLRPNPLDSRSELMVKTAAYHALTGNAYWFLNKRNETAEPVEIWAIPSHQIAPIPDGRMFIKGYTYEPGLGEPAQTLQPWQVVHFKRFHPLNWYVGLSPIESLAVVAQGDMQAQKYNTEFFGKNNGKVPGAIAFADNISDPAWDKLKTDIKEGWGGTQRSGAMLLRGVGQGGVQWVQMSLSQRDMEFLGARTFTKEEIYSIFAPGLASVLAVNATEANAKSGKATFIDMAVWPMLVAVAEKITNNLLPVYGDDLVAEFDDIRVVDRVLELQEQKTYGETHTVDEIRERYYEDNPLGDERGEMLPAQIGPATPLPGDEDEETLGDMPPMTPLTEPAPETMQPMQPLEESPQNEPEAEPDADEADAMQAEVKARKELAAWRRFAVKHGAAKALEFGCEHLQGDVAEVIRGRLAAATNAEEVKAAYSGPFLKAVPEAETEILRKLLPFLRRELGDIVDQLGDPPDLNRLSQFWPAEAAALRAMIEPVLEKVAQEGIAQIIKQGGAVDPAQAALNAAEAIGAQVDELARGVMQTSRQAVESKVGQVIAGSLTLSRLRDALQPFFSEARAGVISATEVTRATSWGKRLAVDLARQSGQHMEAVWHTKNDELVCDICGPLNEQVIPESDPQPPAHPWCRCGITYRWVR